MSSDCPENVHHSYHVESFSKTATSSQMSNLARASMLCSDLESRIHACFFVVPSMQRSLEHRRILKSPSASTATTSPSNPSSRRSPLSLEIVKQNAPLLTLLAPIPHNNARAVDHFTSIAFAVEDAYIAPTALDPITHSPSQILKPPRTVLTQPRPLPQHLPIRHLNKRNPMLPTKRHHKLLIRLLLAPLIQHTHMRLASIQRLARFAKTAS